MGVLEPLSALSNFICKRFKKIIFFVVKGLSCSEGSLLPTAEGSTKSSLFQLSLECTHCDFVVELWNAFSLLFLNKSEGSNKKSLLELLSPCERPVLGPVHLKCRTDWYKNPIQERGHSGNDRQLVLGFPPPCSGMFLERLRRTYVPVGSKKIILN